MDEDSHNFKLRYIGARFDEHRLPVDMLADLPAFRDLIVAFAKQLWRDSHVDRVRVPKGFDKSLSLDLARIEPGSAVPAMTWDRKSAQHELPGVADELSGILNEAYGCVVSLFDDAANDSFPKALSSEFIRPLNKFGSSLRDDEIIEFLDSKGRRGNVVYLTPLVRKNLITKVRETYESRFEGSGKLVGINSPSLDLMSSIKVETLEHGVIVLAVEKDRIKTEFDGHINDSVQFDLTLELNSNDEFKSVVAVHDVELVEFPEGWDRLVVRLEEIGSLRDGWMDGSGLSVSIVAVGAALAMVQARPILGSIIKPFPTQSGGVMLEFELNGWDYSVEFMADGTAEIFGIEVEGDEEMIPQSTTALSTQFYSVLDPLLAGQQ
jgi:hypothetical protein